jgi:hypothetical protein
MRDVSRLVSTHGFGTGGVLECSGESGGERGGESGRGAAAQACDSNY